MEGVARQSAGMKTAATKASEMTATETHPSATEMGTAEMHSSAATTKVHAAAAKVTTASAEVTTAPSAEVTTTSTTVATASTAAATGLRGKWRCNGQHRRQQDCANSNSAIFHGLPPGRSCERGTAWGVST
jgi:hypothetical protein